MNYEIVDPAQFTTEGIFREDVFLVRAEQCDWEKYRDRRVLVRGCASTVIPPWAYMYITGRLVGVARSVRFGNEHDHIVVFRAPQMSEKA